VKKIKCLAKRGRTILALLLALAVVLPASCSKKPERKPLFAVTGKLVDGDKPAARAVVFFRARGAAGPGVLLPVGKVAADGVFHASTYLANDGAPAGEYVLTAIWPKIPKDAPADWDEGPDQLAGRCSDPKTSPWHIRVEEKANDLGTLDLAKWPKTSKPDEDKAKQKSRAGAPE
jgi:hypothetical protein